MEAWYFRSLLNNTTIACSQRLDRQYWLDDTLHVQIAMECAEAKVTVAFSTSFQAFVCFQLHSVLLVSPGACDRRFCMAF